MSVRHVRARRGEHIVVHRDKNSGGCLGFIILIIIFYIIFS